MNILVMIIGGFIATVGIAGVVWRFFPPSNDGALAIAGAVILASGVISNAITSTRQ